LQSEGFQALRQFGSRWLRTADQDVCCRHGRCRSEGRPEV
jgi:hypothetical protein